MNMNTRSVSFRILAGMFSLIMTLLMMLPMKAAFGDVALDVSGRYVGSMEITSELGDTKSHPAVATLRQAGNALTGSIGFSADHQSAIQDGKVHGSALSFSVVLDSGAPLKFSLEAQGGGIQGTARAKAPLGQIRVKLSLSRDGS